MPRKKAAQPPPAAKPPLDGCVITFSGNFTTAFPGMAHAAIETLITSLGGSVARSVTKAVTHLLSTPEDFKRTSGKVEQAKKKDIPIIGLDWVMECQKKQSLVNTDDFALGPFDPSDGEEDDEDEPPAPAATSTSQAPQINGSKKGANQNGTSRKRSVAAVDADDDAKPAPDPKKKKTNGAAPSKSDPKPNGDDAAETKVKKAKETVAEGQIAKSKTAQIPVDEECPLIGCGVFIGDDGMIYDATLNQSNSSHNNNKFYRVQLLRNVHSGVYKTWTRWGRVGNKGQTAILGDGSLDDAIKNFKAKFKDKSGLSWEDRTAPPKPGKYAFLERSYDPDSDSESDSEAADKGKAKAELDADGDDYKEPECTLEKPIQSLMELIFSQHYFDAAMTALNYDANKLPLGKLSKATILRGFQALKDLSAILDDGTLAQTVHGMATHSAIEHFSNLYYSYIPHAFGRNRPPVIQNSQMLKKEIELLESLSDMKVANDIMKTDKKARETIHPLDLQFQGLNLDEMNIVDPETDEFKLLHAYLDDTRGSTHGLNYEVANIFRIERRGEKQRFDDSQFASVKSDRRLLWHGSRCTNFGGILSQGLRIAPPEAPVSGYMFGKGIYLADMSSKSANYCASYISNGHALLLLCEAELGDPMQKLTNASYSAGEDAKAKNMTSTWGMGQTGPKKWKDAQCVHPSLKGVMMPDTSEPPGATNVDNAYLLYNEYICYDVAQVRLRYLLRVKMNSRY